MMDLVATCEVRPSDGQTVIGDRFDMFLGGKGFNQAVAAARAGASTAMIGRVGDDDFGRQFIDALARESIDARAVSRDPSEGTGVGLPVVEASGRNSIVVIPRANHRLTVDDVRAAERVIGAADVVLLQWELPLETAAAAATLAREHGTRVVLNPAPAVGDLTPFAGLVDVIAPNEAEAAGLTGTTAEEACARQLAEQLGGAGVVITLGENGALVRGDGATTRLEPHDVSCVDSVGAGDAFCGSMAAALADGTSLVDAARAGNAAGALAVTVAGAEPSMPHRDAIAALLAR
jgi:ribokinase